MTVGDLRAFLSALSLDPVRETIAETILAELRGRLEYLGRPGSITSRSTSSKTLSGGEAQRIELANALGGA